MFDRILFKNPESVSEVQRDCIEQLNSIFVAARIENLLIKNYFFLGVRGSYLDKPNYCLNFKFNYCGFVFEFFIMYDQLEFYIIKDAKTVKECNIEDFNLETMIPQFISYLRKSVKKFEIIDL